MYRYLSTEFTEEEKEMLHRFRLPHVGGVLKELVLLYGINMDLFKEEGYKPTRVMKVDEYYLIEEEEIFGKGAWQLSVRGKEGYIVISAGTPLEDVLNRL